MCCIFFISDYFALITISELVPASARSTSSSATPLAPQFVPLLSDTLEQVKEVIAKVLPVTKKLSALEEAEWEEESEEGALERELLSQCRFYCFFNPVKCHTDNIS